MARIEAPLVRQETLPRSGKINRQLQLTTWQAWHLRFSEFPAMVPERSSYLTLLLQGYDSRPKKRIAGHLL
jgi:hypothetical protein